MGLYEVKLIKALRFYMKTERDIRIHSVQFHPANKNFVITHFSTALAVGDNVIIDGNIGVITEENIKDFVSDKMKLVMPITALEKQDEYELFQLLNKIDAFVKQFGPMVYLNCLEAGVKDFDDILTNPIYTHLLDSITDPTEMILNELDDLQKLQFEVFSKEAAQNRILH